MYFSIVDKIAAGLDIDSVFICIDFNFVFCFWVVFAFLFFFFDYAPWTTSENQHAGVISGGNSWLNMSNSSH